MPHPDHDPGFSSPLFLSGATGIVGGYLLKTLLEKTTSQIYCLVRAKDPISARERIEKTLRDYHFRPELIERSRSRVVPVPGDVSRPDLGIASEVRAALTRKIAVSINAAGSTSLFSAYGDVERPNVDGVANMISFALATDTRRLIQISSLGMMGSWHFEE